MAPLNNSSVNGFPLSVKHEILTLKPIAYVNIYIWGHCVALNLCECLLFKCDCYCFTDVLMSRPQFIIMDRFITLTLFSCPANRGCPLLPSVPEKRENRD